MIRLHLPATLTALYSRQGNSDSCEFAQSSASFNLPTDITITDMQRIHYLTRVMRIQVGDTILLFAFGKEYQAQVIHILAKSIVLRIINKTSSRNESPLSIYFGQGISRGERMDYSVQKATELGVTEFVPLYTQYTQVKLVGKRLTQRLAHWQAIAESACEQCNRTQVPYIHSPLPITVWLNSVIAERKLVFHEKSTAFLRTDPQPASLAIVVGPEGGLHTNEVHHAQHQGFEAVCLGPRILRTESVAPVALGIVQFLWGDFTNN